MKHPPAPDDHDRGCRRRIALASGAAFACPHGRDVCAECDPCTCVACAGCGKRRGLLGVTLTLLEWPGSGRTAWMCSPCSSPLCELCGINRAAWSVGRSISGNFHVCDACLWAPEVRRKKARPLRGRP